MPLIARFIKKGRTLWEADVANELVDPINALIGTQVLPQGVGEWKEGDNGFVLDLSALAARIKAIEQKQASLEAMVTQLLDEVDA